MLCDSVELICVCLWTNAVAQNFETSFVKTHRCQFWSVLKPTLQPYVSCPNALRATKAQRAIMFPFSQCAVSSSSQLSVFLICSLNQSRACNNVCVCTAFCRVAAFYSFCLCIIVFITSTYEMQFFTGLCSRASVFNAWLFICYTWSVAVAVCKKWYAFVLMGTRYVD